MGTKFAKSRSSSRSSSTGDQQQQLGHGGNQAMLEQLEYKKAEALLLAEESTLDEIREGLPKVSADYLKKLRNDQTVMEEVKKRGDADAVMSLLLLGAVEYKFDYLGNSAHTPFSDMSKELGKDSPDLEKLSESNSTTMNCWQFVMYAQALAGSCSVEDIQGFYASTREGYDWTPANYPNGFTLYDGSAEPSVGDLVIRTGVFETKPEHAMIYIGGGKLMSHDFRGENTQVKSMAACFSALKDGQTLRFGRAPWVPMPQE